MAQAFVLINCELGSEESVITQLKSLEGVTEVHGTFGAYDILAKIESDRVESLRELITWKIRKIENIRSTLTLMGITGQS
ncbi:MAG: Lrp/AsnC ligand binding domain-containing protein [Nitrosopumilus sp.]|jgi:DNA-binding Lrp family transcriptional regulator